MGFHAPPSDDLVNQAAEERAGGATWAAAAVRVGRSADTVRRWPIHFPDRWQAALREAEVRLAGDAAAESVLTLRQLLRSDDETVRRDCARLLIDLRLKLARLGRGDPTDGPTSRLSPEALRFIAFLDGHPDDELAELTADLDPPPRIPGPGVPAGPAGGPG
jgi:hypothetical protein